MKIEDFYRPAAWEHYRASLEDAPLDRLHSSRVISVALVLASVVSVVGAIALARSLPSRTTADLQCTVSGPRILGIGQPSRVALLNGPARTIAVEYKAQPAAGGALLEHNGLYLPLEPLCAGISPGKTVSVGITVVRPPYHLTSASGGHHVSK